MRWVVLLGVAACQTGGDGADKATTENGTGDPGTTPGPAGLVWVDADGEVIDRVAEIGGALRWQDDEGWWWKVVDYEPWFKPETDPVWTYATDAACENLVFTRVAEYPARVVLNCHPGSVGDWYCARIGEIEPVTNQEGYPVDDGVCEPDADPIGAVVPLDDIVTFGVLPQPSWSPPLHPEWR